MNPAQRKKAKAILRPLAEQYAALCIAAEEVIDNISDADFDLVQKRRAELTSTNCGWDEFGLSKVILPRVLGRRRSMT